MKNNKTQKNLSLTEKLNVSQEQQIAGGFCIVTSNKPIDRPLCELAESSISSYLGKDITKLERVGSEYGHSRISVPEGQEGHIEKYVVHVSTMWRGPLSELGPEARKKLHLDDE